MPAAPAEPSHCRQVEDFLRDRGFTHLRARKHGSAVIVESGPADDAIKHVRLRRDTVHLWLLDIADHREKWERTHVRALLKVVLSELVDSFPWVLASRE
jgi:hypothetical protein